MGTLGTCSGRESSGAKRNGWTSRCFFVGAPPLPCDDTASVLPSCVFVHMYLVSCCLRVQDPTALLATHLPPATGKPIAAPGYISGALVRSRDCHDLYVMEGLDIAVPLLGGPAWARFSNSWAMICFVCLFRIHWHLLAQTAFDVLHAPLVILYSCSYTLQVNCGYGTDWLNPLHWFALGTESFAVHCACRLCLACCSHCCPSPAPSGRTTRAACSHVAARMAAAPLVCAVGFFSRFPPLLARHRGWRVASQQPICDRRTGNLK